MNTDANVFIIDDEPAVRESIAALVEEMGIPTETFSSAEEFLDAYHPDRPGCLVTDVRMLGMSGVELLEKLAADGAILPVIIITAYADIPMTVQAIRSGAVTLLEKPCRDQDLWDAIRKALAQDAENRQFYQERREIEQRMMQLTTEERQVMDLMIAGKANKVIAAELNLGLRTVEARRHHVYRKMKTESVAELVQMVVRAETFQKC